MQLINKPNWPVMDEPTFLKLLEVCPDYVRTGYIGAVEYFYRHNSFHFATVWEAQGEETIYVHPNLCLLPMIDSAKAQGGLQTEPGVH